MQGPLKQEGETEAKEQRRRQTGKHMKEKDRKSEGQTDREGVNETE